MSYSCRFKQLNKIMACIFVLILLCSCGSLNSTNNIQIAPDIPGKWDMKITDLEGELKNHNLTFQKKNASDKIMIMTGGENGPHDLIYVFESGRLTKVTQTNVVVARDENSFMSQAKVFETEVLTNWNNGYEAMDKNLQSVTNVLKSFQSITHEGKKYATFMCIWFSDKTAQFTVQFFNPVSGEGETVWSHFVKNDSGYVKR